MKRLYQYPEVNPKSRVYLTPIKEWMKMSNIYGWFNSKMEFQQIVEDTHYEFARDNYHFFGISKEVMASARSAMVSSYELAFHYYGIKVAQYDNVIYFDIPRELLQDTGITQKLKDFAEQYGCTHSFLARNRLNARDAEMCDCKIFSP